MKRNKKRWSVREQADLLKKLGEMMKNGYTLLDALKMLELQMNEKQRKDILMGMRKLTEGYPAFQVLNMISFHKDAVSIIYFAEKHGNLPFAFIQSGELLQRKIDQTEKMKKAAKYPTFLILTVCMITYIMKSAIVPQFSAIYHSMNVKTSFLTSFIFIFFDSFSIIFMLMVVSAIGMLVFYWYGFRKKSFEDQMAFLIRMPLIGRSVKLFNSYFLSLQLSNLLKSGMSIYDSLKAFENQPFIPFYQGEAKHFIKRLKQGEAIEVILNGRPFYEKDLSRAVAHGQLNGHLHRELYSYSQFILDRLEKKAEKWTAMLQPVIYGVTAVMILILYLSMLLPMYQMMNQL
ncbi:competence type IV pilus assembly protein ComGB [Bacillus sp. CLL-7-23]|uniref:Competence type IV pilus assembly protein ComGB n=1 Tax=Bacillus changyiensis TaxID=3004103 RepID=A0ABT4X3S9_9BACI|nr:competence type IV pilus assembly protein ComGB [Bacillus changyiensis]MDA7026957.1 competence type IV pilus assembly protein ComGB [Bacillus changyiensis]